MGLDLITLSEYKQYAGISSPNQDTAIKNLIPKVSNLAKVYCRRTFIDYVSDAKTEVFNGGEFLLPSEYPVISISSLEYSSDYGKTYKKLENYTDYVLDIENQRVYLVTDLPYILNGFKLTYTAGFEEVPQDLKLAVMDLLTYYLKNDMAVKSQRDAGSNTVQIEYITKNTLPSHIARVFDLYIANVS
jgi:hypothetical protein